MRKADYFQPEVKPQVSGCVEFRGEDRGEWDRIKDNQKSTRAALFMQMEENKQKAYLNKKQDWLFDQQRLAVANATEQNQHNHKGATFDVNKDMQQTNQLLDQERKQTEKENREAEIARDRAELKWTNDT